MTVNYERKAKYLMKILVSEFLQNNKTRFAKYIEAYFEYLDQELINYIYNFENVRDAFSMSEIFLDDSLRMFFNDIIDPDKYGLQTDNKKTFLDLSKKILNLKGNEKSFYFLLRSLTDFSTVINGEIVTFEKITMELEQDENWWIPGDDRHQIDPFQSLIAYYKFNNNVYDFTYNKLDLTTYNSPTYTTGIDNITNTAISFDGVNQYAEYAGTNLGKFKNLRSFSCWLYPKSEQSDLVIYHIALIKGENDYGICINYNSSPNKFVIFFKQSDGTVVSTSGYSITDYTQWYHIAGVYDEDNYVKLYINGELYQTSSSQLDGSFYNYDSNSLLIGGDSTTNRNSNCYIDCVKVFQDALSEEEIKMIYLLRESSTTNFIGTIDQTLPSPKAHWELDDLGNIFEDISGNENDMTGTTFSSSDFRYAASINRFGLYLDGTNYANTSTPNTNLSSIRTFSCWFFPYSEQSTANTNNEILSGNTLGFFIDYTTSPNLLKLIFKDSSLTETEISYQINYYTEWYHLVGTYNSSGIVKLYVNGKLVNQTSVLDGSVFDLTSYSIYINSSIRDTVGYIDDSRLYSEVLTEDQILSLYHDRGRKVLSSFYKSQGHWKLNSTTLRDWSGYENSGTGNNIDASNFSQTGTVNRYACQFNGSDEYINVTTTTELYDMKSFSCWVKPLAEQTSGTYHILVQKGTSTYRYGIYINYSVQPNIFTISFTQSDGTMISVNGPDIDSYTEWYNIVGVYDDDNYVKIYINGILSNTSSSTLDGTFYDHSSVDLMIGGGNASSYSNCLIDNVVVFENALTSDEIYSLYQNDNRYKLIDLTEEDGTIQVYPQGDYCKPFNYRFTVDQTYETIESIIDSVHPVGYTLEFVLNFIFGEDDYNEEITLDDELDISVNAVNVFDGSWIFDGSIDFTGGTSESIYLVKKVLSSEYTINSTITKSGYTISNLITEGELWQGDITYEQDNTVNFTFPSVELLKEFYIKVNTAGTSTDPYNFCIEVYDTSTSSWLIKREFNDILFESDVYKPFPFLNEDSYTQYRINFISNLITLFGISFENDVISDFISGNNITTVISTTRLILFNETSTQETIAINTPYINDNLGLRTGPSYQNLLFYSEDFSDATWVKTNLTVATDGVFFTSINGYRITTTTTDGYISQETTLTQNEYYSYSLYFKEGNCNIIRFLIQTDTISTNKIDIKITYNFTTGIKVLTQTDVSGANNIWFNINKYDSIYKLEFGFEALENFTIDGFKFGPDDSGSIGDYVITSIAQKTNTKTTIPYSPNTSLLITIDNEGNFTTDGSYFDTPTYNTDLEDLLFSVSTIPEGEITFNWTPQFSQTEINETDNISNIFTFYNDDSTYFSSYNNSGTGEIRFLPKITGITTESKIQYNWQKGETLPIKATFGKPGSIFAAANGLDTSKYYFRITVNGSYLGNFVEYTTVWNSDTTNLLRFGFESENFQNVKNIIIKNKPISWLKDETDTIEISNIIPVKETTIDL